MYYSKLKIHNRSYIYAMYQKKLAYFGLEHHALKDLVQDFPNEKYIEIAHASKEFEEEIYAYFNKKLTQFNTQLYFSGTEFQKSVYHILQQVPYGTTLSYSELAIKVGDIKKVRAVASAVGKNRHLILIPCHRIIAKNGSLGGFSSGLDLKEELLEIEQIKV